MTDARIPIAYLVPDYIVRIALADALFEQIKHGSDQHQKWLKDQIEQFFWLQHVRKV